MKQTLQIRLGQNITMTPQLQQAIKLLQLSAIELEQEVQRALEENPLLEQDEKQTDTELQNASESYSEQNSHDDDGSWEFQIRGNAPSSSAVEYDADNLYQGETTEDLREYLLWQMHLSPFSKVDQSIAETLIDAIDDSGYLQTSLEDVLKFFEQNTEQNTEQDTEQDTEQEIILADIEIVLKRIQHFDPIGVGARSVQECLLIQLEQCDASLPSYAHAQTILTNHMDLLGSHDYRTLQRVMKLSPEALEAALVLIQSLEPRPGNQIKPATNNYIIPDVIVEKEKGVWRARLNPEAIPRIRINNNYINLINASPSSNHEQFVRTHVQEARWFIKSLESRNETLLKVTQCIIDRQNNFLELGEEAMSPLILNDVAEAIDMHESTISRITTQKFMHTPRGTFELKYFFSSQVATQTGSGCSSTAIRALIKKLIANENPKRPLSDSKITHLLCEQGIIVARRTIAKYREALLIPPSSQRKRLS